MIKRITFATRRPDLTPEAFEADWPRVAGGGTAAPPGARPARIAVCTTLADLTGPDPVHDGIGLEWFADADHLERYQAWLATADGQTTTTRLHEVVDAGASPVVVAEESVLRGAEWLERRWREGGERLKHIAIALRAEGLTAAEFSARWRSRAGQVRRPGDAEVTAIPDEARGCAYVQDHPCPRPEGEWAYDAVNEVWFDDVEDLRVRIEWFRRNLAGSTEEDLVRRSWFLAAREQVVLA